MKRKPAAFMSYAHVDDKYGRLTEFCEHLSHEVQVLTGEEFPIFQDHNDIHWGQTWEACIEGALCEVTFLIPIITPSFFNSAACFDELQQFIEHEKELKRDDLILPVYYVDCPLLNDEGKRANNELAQVIAARQYEDWREIRHDTWTSPQVSKKLEKLAIQIREALERVKAPPETVVPGSAPSAMHRPARELSPPLMEGAESVSESEDVTRGPSAKTEPPICVVDKKDRDNPNSITEAIEMANPGDRILVRPGIYQEGMVMNKPLEIIGDGDPGEVVVQATGKNALLFQTTMGRVANLTLQQMEGGEWHCVDIAQGRLDMEGCDISSQSRACVAIHGDADPRLRRNRVHDGKFSGIYVYDNGQGTLENNDIFRNAYSGVKIDGGNPTLYHNHIHDNREGVYVYGNGQGTLEINDIFGNVVGVEIQTDGNPMLRYNRIHDSKQNGVYVWNNGQGRLEDNDIFGNALDGVWIGIYGNPTMRHNHIHDNKQNGVHVHDNGQGTLEDNDIFGNAHSGVVISAGSNPTLRRNRIHDGKQSGVYVYDNGQGTLEDNDIFGNAHSGVVIATGGNPTLRHNRINRNDYVAVQVYDGGAAIIEDNDLSSNAQGVWDISPDSEPNVKRARNLE